MTHISPDSEIKDAVRFLWVDMTPQEDLLFDSVCELLPVLPQEGPLPEHVNHLLQLLTADAQDTLRHHPQYNFLHILNLCNTLCKHLTQRPELLPYMNSAMRLALFIKRDTRPVYQSKRGKNKYELAIMARCMFHLRDLMYQFI